MRSRWSRWSCGLVDSSKQNCPLGSIRPCVSVCPCAKGVPGGPGNMDGYEVQAVMWSDGLVHSGCPSGSVEPGDQGDPAFQLDAWNWWSAWTW